MSARSTGRRKPAALWNPFVEILTTSAEMSWAAAQTITHRLALMHRAGMNPNAFERREMVRMGTEKSEAATRSVQAMSGEWQRFNRHMAALVEQQTAIAGTWAAFASVDTLAELAVAQQRYWAAASRGGEAAFGVWTAGVRMAHKGMLPIHARATANANRLGAAGQSKRKRRAARR